MARPIIKPLPEDAPDMYAFAKQASNDAKPDYKALAKQVEHIRPIRQYPIWYHCRGGDSDKNFVLSRMRWIPDSLKHWVSLEFERLFLAGGREGRYNAKKFLHELASSYRNEGK
ncbi:hypothetical protein [Shewanella sp. SM69]|uniref:hypothetical protein n=1 Tax=Shewanella TaxID=22 RepID=UPI0021DA97CC|nr:hypothetical protein [Shewanella sp. SM69]MCU8036963.1 hypothetical protein [Shewanella sp. SM69]